MIKADSKNGFGKFPISLQLVVIWLGLAVLFDLIQFVRSLWDNVGFLLFGIVNLILVIGIINKRNLSRLLTILWVSMASLMRLALLAPIAMDSEFTPGPQGLNFGFVYFTFSKYQMIALIVLNIVLNFAALFVLLKPGIKAIFLPQPTRPETI